MLPISLVEFNAWADHMGVESPGLRRWLWKICCDVDVEHREYDIKKQDAPGHYNINREKGLNPPPDPDGPTWGPPEETS